MCHNVLCFPMAGPRRLSPAVDECHRPASTTSVAPSTLLHSRKPISWCNRPIPACLVVNFKMLALLIGNLLRARLPSSTSSLHSFARCFPATGVKDSPSFFDCSLFIVFPASLEPTSLPCVSSRQYIAGTGLSLYSGPVRPTSHLSKD